jgi:hypothetical protein
MVDTNFAVRKLSKILQNCKEILRKRGISAKNNEDKKCVNVVQLQKSETENEVSGVRKIISRPENCPPY